GLYSFDSCMAWISSLQGKKKEKLDMLIEAFKGTNAISVCDQFPKKLQQPMKMTRTTLHNKYKGTTDFADIPSMDMFFCLKKLYVLDPHSDLINRTNWNCCMYIIHADLEPRTLGRGISINGSRSLSIERGDRGGALIMLIREAWENHMLRHSFIKKIHHIINRHAQPKIHKEKK
ncbi:hypothetical protein ACJX0J_009907, partial [Zea mays]